MVDTAEVVATNAEREDEEASWPEPAMRVEQAFLGALPQAARFDTTRTGDGVLLIRDHAGAELLRFEKAP